MDLGPELEPEPEPELEPEPEPTPTPAPAPTPTPTPAPTLMLAPELKPELELEPELELLELELPEPELPEPELPEPELLTVAQREFNSRPLSRADQVAKAKAQAAVYAAKAEAFATERDAAAATRVVSDPLPLRDSSICPQDGDPVNPDEPGYLSERFTAFWSDEPGDDNWIGYHPAHPGYITAEEEFDQLVACYVEAGGWQRLPDDAYHNRIRDACRGEQLAQGLIEPTRMDKKKKRGQSSHRQARKPAGGRQARKPAGRSALLGVGAPQHRSLWRLAPPRRRRSSARPRPLRRHLA